MAAYQEVCAPPFTYEVMADCYNLREKRWVHWPEGTYNQQISSKYGRITKRLVELTAKTLLKIREVKERQKNNWADKDNPNGVDQRFTKDQEFLKLMTEAAKERSAS